MELEAAGSSKHQTESSADRQLPVGDVYSLKLPWAFVSPAVDGSVQTNNNNNIKKTTLPFLQFAYTHMLLVKAGNHMVSSHLANLTDWLPFN